MTSRPLLAAMSALILCVSGCAHLASVSTAWLMVRAPNKLDPRIALANLKPLNRRPGTFDQRFRVSVGPPRADLLVSVIDPEPRGALPSGTILVLHGAYGRSESMLKTADALASGGYRAVLVDLRGHGRSTGERLTYGVEEAKDLSRVIDVLQQRRLIAGGLGVYGFSFGGSTAIQLAGRDPRVGAVVAVAPYGSLHAAASEVVRTWVPGGRLFATDQWVDDTLRRAGRYGDFDVHRADPMAAIRQTRAGVLLVHGDADDFIKPHHSILLHQAAADHSHVLFVSGADHPDMAGDPRGTAAALAVWWFDRWMRQPAAEWGRTAGLAALTPD